MKSEVFSLSLSYTRIRSLFACTCARAEVREGRSLTFLSRSAEYTHARAAEVRRVYRASSSARIQYVRVCVRTVATPSVKQVQHLPPAAREPAAGVFSLLARERLLVYSGVYMLIGPESFAGYTREMYT